MEWALYLILLSTTGGIHADELERYVNLSDCAEIRGKLSRATAEQRNDTLLQYRCVPVPY